MIQHGEGPLAGPFFLDIGWSKVESPRPLQRTPARYSAPQEPNDLPESSDDSLTRSMARLDALPEHPNDE